MPNSLVQFRMDDITRVRAIGICERLGIDLPTYMRMCVAKLIEENGVPFSLKLADHSNDPGIASMRRLSEEAQRNGVANLSLEEINAEIDAARADRG